MTHVTILSRLGAYWPIACDAGRDVAHVDRLAIRADDVADVITLSASSPARPAGPDLKIDLCLAMPAL